MVTGGRGLVIAALAGLLSVFHAQALVAQTRRGDAEPSPEDVLARANQALDDVSASQESGAQASGLMDIPLRLIAQARSRLRSRHALVAPRDAVALARVARQAPAVDEETTQGIVVSWLIQSLVYAILTAMVAYFFYTKKLEIDIEAGRSQFEGKPFTHHPFSCLDSPEVCIWSFCCPAIKWADNMNSLSFYGFWAALGIWLFFQASANLILMTWLFGAGLFAYNRQKMRTTFGMKNENGDMAADCAMYLCCWCCAVTQESRHLAEIEIAKPSDPTQA